jgi:hypothetical protein
MQLLYVCNLISPHTHILSHAARQKKLITVIMVIVDTYTLITNLNLTVVNVTEHFCDAMIINLRFGFH